MADEGGTGIPGDPHDLDRFVQAQKDDYERALAEIRAGRKRSHWMWYIFPQYDGLGFSSMAQRYAIKSVAEAEAYLRHPVLGPRLIECAEAVVGVEGKSAHEIFGSPDDVKLRSCATLFARVSPADSVFERLLRKYYPDGPDEKTLRLLQWRPSRLAEPAMPLLDHFYPPLSRTHPRRAFHGAWASAMARLLNAGVLPPGYYAVPFLDREGPVEVDVATLREFDPSDAPGAVPTWAPTAPGLAVAVEWPAADEVRVEVYADDGDPRLTAAVEPVSPSNKDRRRSREAFAAKCAGYLRRGCGVVVVDAVTTRRADLHADLLATLGAGAGPAASVPLSAVAYRPVGRGEDGRLLTWPEAMEVGQPLPTVPLWVGADLAVPLDLEASHTAACADLRIRQAGELGRKSVGYAGLSEAASLATGAITRPSGPRPCGVGRVDRPDEGESTPRDAAELHTAAGSGSRPGDVRSCRRPLSPLADDRSVRSRSRPGSSTEDQRSVGGRAGRSWIESALASFGPGGLPGLNFAS